MSLTEEQKAQIVRIKRCQNHYEVLNVSKTANVNEIKAASKKILRLIHPDKNHHPEAKLVTQRVNKAVEVLGDPLKRLNYDFTLANKPSEPHVPRPEPSVPREKPFQSENVNNTPKPQDANNKHYVPVFIVILAIVALAYLGISRDPPYSLHRTGDYRVLKRTAKHAIEYFIQPEVSWSSSDFFRQIEKTIEEEFFVKLKESCLEEINKRRRGWFAFFIFP
jgi:curved DNA-binding protein CbpA